MDTPILRRSLGPRGVRGPCCALLAFAAFSAACADGSPGITEPESEPDVVSEARFTIAQTLSDEAQRNTTAFDGLAFLTTSQVDQLVTAAKANVQQISSFAYRRFPLLKAFRRHLEGAFPTGTTTQRAAVTALAAKLGYLHPAGAFLYSAPIPMPAIESTDAFFR